VSTLISSSLNSVFFCALISWPLFGSVLVNNKEDGSKLSLKELKKNLETLSSVSKTSESRFIRMLSTLS
jgi:hypothetical protein